MNINLETPLVLSSLYEYDFSSCYYTILKNVHFDLSKINPENKQKRNIALGILQKNNPMISNFLLENTNLLIDLYLSENNISPEEVIIRQRDGVILSKPMTKLNITMPIDFRGDILKLIFSVKRNSFLFLNSKGKVIVKGIKKPANSDFYNSFKNLDFCNKSNMINGLERIRLNIMSSLNILQFAFEDGDELLLPISNGSMKVKKSLLSSMSINNINRTYTWETCVWPFAESLMVFVNEQEKAMNNREVVMRLTKKDFKVDTFKSGGKRQKHGMERIGQRLK